VRLLILVAVIFAFRLTARLVWLVIRIFWRRTHASQLFIDLIGRLFQPTATLIGFIVGLGVLGVNPTTLLTGLGVVSVIVGLALQDSLSNLAAGLFILLYRPYEMDDVVQAGGVVGNVKAMGLANTTIITFDNRRLYVPNRKIWSEIIENRSTEVRRRVEVSLRIGYREDLEAALQTIRDELEKYEKTLTEPEPQVFVTSLGESWVEIAVWPWASTENWWTATTELPKVLQLGLRAAGIEAPVPRREVELKRDQAES
jgi:small conductance mechanosensitive channel